MRTSLLIRITISFILGASAVFSYAPFHLWFLAFISFSGLLVLIQQPRIESLAFKTVFKAALKTSTAKNHPLNEKALKAKALEAKTLNESTIKVSALLGFAWGIGYFVAGVHWVYISIKQYGELPTPLALAILLLFVSYLALYPTLFATLLHVIKVRFKLSLVKQLLIIAPIIWYLTESIRAHLLNGFAWLQFGYTQLDSPLKTLFPLVGIDGVNFLFTLISSLIAYLILQFIQYQPKQHTPKHRNRAVIALIVCFIAPLSISSLAWTQTDPTRPVNITLIQGNIAQSLRWNPGQLNQTLATYTTLSEQNFANSDIIIWPEAAITDTEINQRHYLIRLDTAATQHNVAIAVGLIDLIAQPQGYDIYNSLIVLGDDQPYQYPTQNRYSKHHLVPFGEYTPLANILKPLANLLDIPMSSMSAGAEVQPNLMIKGFTFATAICYEIILSDLVWKNMQADTDFILTISNDAWFGNSIGPWQHLQMATARALEFGRTVIRSTNNGITTVINPQGQIVKQLPQFETAVLTAEVYPNTGTTPYTRWGKMPLYIVISVMLASLFIHKRKH